MFGELPKLLDRKFVLGYFLPSTFFVSVTVYLFIQFNFKIEFFNKIQSDIFSGATILGVISLILGLLLLGMNQSIIRFAEGYGKYNPLKLLLVFEKKKYEKTKKEIDNLNNSYKKAIEEKEIFPSTLRIKRISLTQEIASRFPDQIDWIMPTPFGNIIRAFEVYPRVVYGIEGVQGWSRLIAVIPKEYLELISDLKSQLDFWLNLELLSIVFVIEYVGLSFYTGEVKLIWLLILAIVVIIGSESRVRNSAIQWGELIKSSFDVFLPKLLKELNANSVGEIDREFWTKFSQTIIYRIPFEKLKAKSRKRIKKS